MYAIKAHNGYGVPVSILFDGLCFVENKNLAAFTFPIEGSYEEGEIYYADQWLLQTNPGDHRVKIYKIVVH